MVAKSIKVSLRPAPSMRVSSMRSGGRFNAAGMPVQRAPGGQGGGAFGMAFKPEANGTAPGPGGGQPSEGTAATLSVTFNDLYAGWWPLPATTRHCYCHPLLLLTHYCYCRTLLLPPHSSATTATHYCYCRTL